MLQDKSSAIINQPQLFWNETDAKDTRKGLMWPCCWRSTSSSEFKKIVWIAVNRWSVGQKKVPDEKLSSAVILWDGANLRNTHSLKKAGRPNPCSKADGHQPWSSSATADRVLGCKLNNAGGNWIFLS